MSVSEQFSGLDMHQLIGAPLSAAADASMQLAQSTADFINEVGFEEQGKVRTTTFKYQKPGVNEDGTEKTEEIQVEVPVLAIVPLPNLQIDEVNVLFDMEVQQSEGQEAAKGEEGGMSGTANLGIVKVKVSGSVSSQEHNPRSSDDSAKYHLDVRDAEHGTPEGLQRVLDMMSEAVPPLEPENNSESP